MIMIRDSDHHHDDVSSESIDDITTLTVTMFMMMIVRMCLINDAGVIRTKDSNRKPCDLTS